MIGIYLLRFSDRSFYIGQSRSIERRYTTHCNRLKNKTHPNWKMQEVYDRLGKPNLEILCECDVDKLDQLEIEAFEIFDPCTLGLNISPPAGEFPISNGENNGFARYSNEYIINWVKYALLHKNLALKLAAGMYGIHYSTAKNISNGTSHRWLKDIIPNEYLELLSLADKREVNSSGSRGVIYTVISPSNEEHTVTNICKFAREHNLNAGALGEVLRKKAIQHKGWKLK